MPTVLDGEPAWGDDTGELYIGGKTGRPVPIGMGIRPEAFGARGDGTTDDIAAFYSATLAAYQTGKSIVLTPGKTYLLSDIWMLHGNIHVWGNGAVIYNTGTGTSAYTPGGNTVNANSPIWAVEYSLGTAYQFDAGALYDSSVTVTTASEAGNFAAGDYVFLYWGTDPTDSNEEYGRDVNIVRSANATTGVVELEYPVMYDFSEVTPAPYIRKLNYPFTGSIQGLTIRSLAGSDVGLYAARNLYSTFRDIKFENIGEVCFAPIESRGVTADNLSSVKNLRDGTASDLCHAWGCVDMTLRGLHDHGTYSHPTILMESQNRGVLITDSTFIGRDVTSATFPIQISGGTLDVEITNCKFANVYQIFLVNQDSVLFFHGNRVYGVTQPYIAGADPADSTVVFRDNWIDGRWQGRHEVIRFYKIGVGANEGGGNMEQVFPNSNMVEPGVPYGYRIKVVGTVSSGTLGPIDFQAGSSSFQEIAASITTDTYGYFDPGTFSETLMKAAAGSGFNVALFSTSLNPADSIDIYVDLFVEH